MGEQHDIDTDHDLLRAWRGGDNRAGNSLYRRHAGAISRFFRNKLTCADDPADLLQETFLALQRTNENAASESTPATVRRYLYATANHVLCAYLRKKYKRQSEQLDFGTVCVKDLEPTSLSSILVQRRDLQIFVESLRAIPLEDQTLLELKYFDDLSIRDLGELLDLPETAVPGRLQRAKGRLRQRVEQSRSQLRDPTVSEPSDDELERWAQEIRQKMGWQAAASPDQGSH